MKTLRALIVSFSFATTGLAGCASPRLATATGPHATLAVVATEARDGQHDFDFLYGEWNLRVRRLRHPLHGSHDWYEMTGTTVCRPFWDGRANLEVAELDGPDGHMEGAMVRLYSLTSRQWSLNWTNQKNGRFDVPTVGTFKDGRGEFYDQETFEGRTILVRYVWSDTTTSAPHFEQSFSDDGGKTWEPNWEAWQSKVGEGQPLPEPAALRAPGTTETSERRVSRTELRAQWDNRVPVIRAPASHVERVRRLAARVMR